MPETLTTEAPVTHPEQIDLSAEPGWTNEQMDLTRQPGWDRTETTEDAPKLAEADPTLEALRQPGKVIVERGDGRLEGDWDLDGLYRTEEGIRVRVTHPVEGSTDVDAKYIPIEEFRSLNPDSNLLAARQTTEVSTQPTVDETASERSTPLTPEDRQRIEKEAKEYFDSLDKYFDSGEIGRDHDALETVKEMRRQLAEAEQTFREAAKQQLEELGIDEGSIARLAPGKIDESLAKFRGGKISELANLIKDEPDKKTREVNRTRENLAKLLNLPEDQFAQLERDWNEKRKGKAHEQALKEDKNYKVGEKRQEARQEISQLQEEYGGVLAEVARLPLDRDPAGNVAAALSNYGSRRAIIKNRESSGSVVDTSLLLEASRAKAIEDLDKELTAKYRNEGLNDEQIATRLAESHGALDTWLAHMGDSPKALEDLQAFELQQNKERLWSAKRQKTREYLSMTLLPKAIRGVFNRSETKNRPSADLDIKEIMARGVDHSGSHTKVGGEALLGSGGKGLWEQTVSSLELARNLARNEGKLMQGLIYLTFARKGLENGAEAVWRTIPMEKKKEARKQFMLGMSVTGRAILRASLKTAEKSRKAGTISASFAAEKIKGNKK